MARKKIVANRERMRKFFRFRWYGSTGQRNYDEEKLRENEQMKCYLLANWFLHIDIILCFSFHFLDLFSSILFNVVYIFGIYSQHYCVSSAKNDVLFQLHMICTKGPNGLGFFIETCSNKLNNNFKTQKSGKDWIFIER